MTQLAVAMGDKGITAKLKKTVSKMIIRGAIEKIAGEENTNKLRIKK